MKNNNINFLQNLINKTLLSSQKYKLYDILGQNELNITINTLENIYDNLEKINSDDNNKINALQDDIISVIKNLCHFSIVIDIGQYTLSKLDFSNAKSITKRAKIITSNKLKHLLSLQADFVIEPDTLGKEWSDFEACEDLLVQGRISAENNIVQLMQIINEKQSN